MRKFWFIFAALLITSFVFSQLDVGILHILTVDPENALVDYFPLMYLKYKPVDWISFRFTQYGSTQIEESGTSYYYLESYQRLGNISLIADFGKSRLKKTNLEKLEFLRTGGLKENYQGIGGSIRYGNFETGGYYSFFEDNMPYAVYGAFKSSNFKVGIYYSGRYDEVSADFDSSFDILGADVNIWGGLSADVANLTSPSALLGSKLTFNAFGFPISLAGQYLWIGSGYVDFAYGDPNEDASIWSSDFEFTVDLDSWISNLQLGVLGKYNSKLFTENSLPLIALKAKVSDLELYYLMTGEDLHTRMTGNQKLLIKWVHYMKLFSEENFKTQPASVKSTKTTPSKESYKSVTAMILKASKPPIPIKIKGYVTVPANLLGKNQIYIADPTGGILVYVPNGIKQILKVGEIVEVYGKFKEYYGMPEVVAAKISKTNQKAKIVVRELDHAPTYSDLGNLVKIKGKVVKKANYKLLVKTNGFEIKVYIKKNTGINLRNINVGDTVEITGIVSIYKGEFELLPRFPEDLVAITE